MRRIAGATMVVLLTIGIVATMAREGVLVDILISAGIALAVVVYLCIAVYLIEP
jgi:hypothetical protein